MACCALGLPRVLGKQQAASPKVGLLLFNSITGASGGQGVPANVFPTRRAT